LNVVYWCIRSNYDKKNQSCYYVCFGLPLVGVRAHPCGCHLSCEGTTTYGQSGHVAIAAKRQEYGNHGVSSFGGNEAAFPLPEAIIDRACHHLRHRWTKLVIEHSSLATSSKQEITKQKAKRHYQSTLNTVTSIRDDRLQDVVAANLSLAERQNSLQSAQQALETAKTKYEAGKASTLAVSQAEVTESDAEYAVLVAQQTLDSARTTLSNLIGTTGDWTYEDMPDAITWELDSLLAKFPAQRHAKLPAGIDTAKLSSKTTTATDGAERQRQRQIQVGWDTDTARFLQSYLRNTPRSPSTVPCRWTITSHRPAPGCVGHARMRDDRHTEQANAFRHCAPQ
jgi:hypothetical protein